VSETTATTIPGAEDPHEAAPEMSQRRVLGLAVPIIGENLLQTLVGVVDTLFVAALGANALAGVGVASEVVFFVIAILSAVSIGGTVLVSQAIGARDQERANRLARQAVAWGLVIAIPLSFLGYFLAPTIVGWFQTEAGVATEATTYLRITGAMFVVLLMTFVCGAVLRGAGDSQTPLRASLIANLLNGFLAYAMIFGEFGFPRMEVAGSAWSTVIGRGAGALILLWFLFSGRRAVSLAGREGWWPSVSSARALMQIGVPAAIERILDNAGITTLVVIIAMIGTDALAAQQIIFTAYAIALLPGSGFSVASTALVGQSLGARRLDHAKLATRISIRWALAWMIVAGLAYLLLARHILDVFTDDAAVINHGDGGLMALGLTLPIMAFRMVFGGGLRALGDARTPMITGSISTWLAVGLAWVGVQWFDATLTWVWVSFLLASPIAAVANRLVFARRLHTVELTTLT